VRPAQSRRSRVNVIAAPRETLVTNVGTFRIPNRLLKSLPYPVFRMAAVPLAFAQRVGHAMAALSKQNPDGASLTLRISSIESDATALAFLLRLRQRPS
jgi:hypothetical protein